MRSATHLHLALIFVDDGNFTLELSARDDLRDRCIVNLKGIYSLDAVSKQLFFEPPANEPDYPVATDLGGGSRILCDVLLAQPPLTLSLRNTTVAFAEDCSQWTGDFDGVTLTWSSAAPSLSALCGLLLGLLLASLAL